MTPTGLPPQCSVPPAHTRTHKVFGRVAETLANKWPFLQWTPHPVERQSVDGHSRSLLNTMMKPWRADMRARTHTEREREGVCVRAQGRDFL